IFLTGRRNIFHIENPNFFLSHFSSLSRHNPKPIHSSSPAKPNRRTNTIAPPTRTPPETSFSSNPPENHSKPLSFSTSFTTKQTPKTLTIPSPRHCQRTTTQKTTSKPPLKTPHHQISTHLLSFSSPTRPASQIHNSTVTKQHQTHFPSPFTISSFLQVFWLKVGELRRKH
ncbi:hypothetical protein AABB24_029523, partial [Solanum stoloniferum]